MITCEASVSVEVPTLKGHFLYFACAQNGASAKKGGEERGGKCLQANPRVSFSSPPLLSSIFSLSISMWSNSQKHTVAIQCGIGRRTEGPTL